MQTCMHFIMILKFIHAWNANPAIALRYLKTANFNQLAMDLIMELTKEEDCFSKWLTYILLNHYWISSNAIWLI